MIKATRPALLCLGLLIAGPAIAQSAPPKPATATGQIDPALLKAARVAVQSMQGDRAALLGSMSGPMTAMSQQMGLKEDQAQVIVQEVVMPILTSHFDELLDIQALSLAAVLGADDLKAITAFYESPAGRRLVTAQPKLTQALLVGIRQWMATLMPEMQAKITQAAKARGWAPGGAAKP